MTLQEFKEKADWLEKELTLLQDAPDGPETDARFQETLKWEHILGTWAYQNNLVTWRQDGKRIVKAIPIKLI